jgi:hypothetical protein
MDEAFALQSFFSSLRVINGSAPSYGVKRPAARPRAEDPRRYTRHRLEWQEHTPPFYCSVDLRNAGFKLAPVDTNLFPGAFNNLPQEVLPLAVQAAMASIEKICPDAKNLLVIPERHTRNAFYLENVARLATIMRQAGLNVRFGTLDESIVGPVTIALSDGQKIVLEPLERTPRKPARAIRAATVACSVGGTAQIDALLLL